MLNKLQSFRTRLMLFVSACAVMFFAAFQTMAAAAVDSDIQNTVDSFSLTWLAIKGAIIIVLLFVVGWKLAKRFLKG